MSVYDNKNIEEILKDIVKYSRLTLDKLKWVGNTINKGMDFPVKDTDQIIEEAWADKQDLGPVSFLYQDLINDYGSKERE